MAKPSKVAPLVRQHERGSDGWRRVDEGLTRIAAWCRERKIPKYLIAMPLFSANADTYREVLDRVVVLARSKGFVAHNALDDFGGKWADLAVSAWDAHPGAGAHAILAKRLFQLLSKGP